MSYHKFHLTHLSDFYFSFNRTKNDLISDRFYRLSAEIIH